MCNEECEMCKYYTKELNECDASDEYYYSLPKI